MNKPGFAIVLLILVGGCASQLPPIADEKIAMDSLSQALESWKDGNRPEALQTQVPPIYVNEQLWSRSLQLMDYSVISSQLSGQGWNCAVELKLRQPNGQTSQRRVDYRIDTHPSVVIVQQP